MVGLTVRTHHSGAFGVQSSRGGEVGNGAALAPERLLAMVARRNVACWLAASILISA
jgi:hypothetical protein